MALNERYHMMVEKCMSSLKKWQSFIHDYLEDEEKATELTKLQNVVKEYCSIDNNHRKSEQALKTLEQNIESPSKEYDIDEMFKTSLNEQDDEDITNNEIWQTLFQNDVSIQEVKAKKSKDKSKYEGVTEDDSVLCSTSFTAPVDPISKVVIRNPVRNKKCKHVYESNSIYGYIRQSKGRAKCPYMGCNNNKLTPADLQEDLNLASQITQYMQTQTEEDIEEDDSD